MARADDAVLRPLSRTSLASSAGLAALWPKPSPALTIQLVEHMQVLSLRHLAGGGATELAAVLAAHGLPALPGPGRSRGHQPRLIWRSPDESLLLTPDAAQAAALLAALKPSPGALACALDQSPGVLVLELLGHGVDALLARLVDAQAVPRDTGDASRMRLADIAALVWREAPDHMGLLIDRANDHYLARWLRHAADAI